MCSCSPVWSCLAVHASAIFVVARLARVRRLHRLTAGAIAAKADESSTMIETVRGIATIKLFGRRGDRLRLWQNRRADAINADLRLQRRPIWFELLGEGVTRIETVLFVVDRKSTRMNSSH